MNITKWFETQIFNLISMVAGGVTMFLNISGRLGQVQVTGATDAGSSVTSVTSFNWVIFIIAALLFLTGLIGWKNQRKKHGRKK